MVGPEHAPLNESELSLDEVRHRHPGWTIEAIFGGYVAYPVGVTIVRMMFVGGLDERLTQLDAQ